MDTKDGALRHTEPASITEITTEEVSECGLKNALRGIPAQQIHIFLKTWNVLEILDETSVWMNSLPCPYLAFLNTSPQQIIDFEAVQTPGIRKQYIESLQILIIKLPFKAQEVVTEHISYRLRRKAVLMGDVDEELGGTGSTTYRSTNTIFCNTCKEADAGIIPHQRRPGPHGWPTIIFESAVSESLERLHEDARWWLTQNNQEVHAVLLAHIFRAEQIIDLEVWRILPIKCEGASVGSDAQRMPQIDNQLRINCSTFPHTISGTVPFFVIGFKDLVLRDKTAGEEDFFLDFLDIQSIATLFRVSM
ncbi:hypothetical protein B9Z19DRAFT_1060923 [Tuber borchii]|uniref:Uncharacterized protein n=1 Tax=Tuber borchii TaxID=42251 RepID=A0A2T7A724_TUBBO|nr:hypothetical protein B9Z19DRAFT_1060923 [Tuber borchii]